LKALHAADPAQAYKMIEHELLMREDQEPLRNVLITIYDMQRDKLVVENEMFSRNVLESYTDMNLGKTMFYRDGTHSLDRGGDLGYYADGMKEKIETLLKSLRDRPFSKRSLLTIPPFHKGSVNQRPERDDDAKCLRELHFYVNGDRELMCTGIMRAQVSMLFPKNVHMIGTLLNDLAESLGYKVGAYTHFITTLTDSRSA